MLLIKSILANFKEIPHDELLNAWPSIDQRNTKFLTRSVLLMNYLIHKEQLNLSQLSRLYFLEPPQYILPKLLELADKGVIDDYSEFRKAWPPGEIFFSIFSMYACHISRAYELRIPTFSFVDCDQQSLDLILNQIEADFGSEEDSRPVGLLFSRGYERTRSNLAGVGDSNQGIDSMDLAFYTRIETSLDLKQLSTNKEFGSFYHYFIKGNYQNEN